MYDQLREKALANFELLLNYWGIEWTKISDKEYDFINPNRDDKNFGACRFNIEKGRGADFAGISFTSYDYSRIGFGFDKEDFSSYHQSMQTKWGFDIIGLTQKLYKFNSYKEASKRLNVDLQEISKKEPIIIPDKNAAEERRHRQAEQQQKLILSAQKIWKICSKNKVLGSLGNYYLMNRGLLNAYKEENIRYHDKIINVELGRPVPCLLFKIQIQPGYPLVAIHRIYLSNNGHTKADVANPKKALASIKGAAIWFGHQTSILHISEGPENALTLREQGCEFVACAINGANFSNLKIPENVHTVILSPDPDPSGDYNLEKAIKMYQLQGKKIKEIKLPKLKKSNGKFLDLNDFHMGLDNAR